MHFINRFQSNCMSFRFSLDSLHQQSFIFWSSIWETHHAWTSVINKCSLKTVMTEPVHLCTLHTVSYQLHINLQHHDSFLHRQLCLDWGSSWRLLLPRWNSAAQCATTPYNGTSSLYTTVICLCIWYNWMFSSIKNSISVNIFCQNSSYYATSYFQYTAN